MITIKRYSNRKLYDTENSKYITIDDIAELIKNNVEIRVIDNKTNEDITNVVMANVILKLEKNDSGFVHLKNLKEIIQNKGDSISNYISKTKVTIKNEVDKIIKRGEEELKESVNNIFLNNFLKEISLLKDKISKLEEEIKYLKDKIDKNGKN